MTVITDEMVERAAKALWEEASERQFGYWENVGGKWQDAWRKSALAALRAALSEKPTDWLTRGYPND